MEELANFIWIGGVVSELGPSGCQKLWKLLQPALWHYFHSRQGSVEDMREADKILRGYAEELERLVLRGKVSRIWCLSECMLPSSQTVLRLCAPYALG
jgi:hypothetical protein